MESLVTALTDSLLHPAVLVAAAAATLLLFSGTVGRMLEFLEGRRVPSLPAPVRHPRAGTARARTRFSRSTDTVPAGTWQPPQAPRLATVCSRTTMTHADLEQPARRTQDRRRRRHRGSGSPRHVPIRHRAGAMVATRSTPDSIGRTVEMPRASTVGG